MSQRNTSNAYTGPSVREMVATHTLAKEIIARHNDPCPIFDDQEILRVRRFVQDPSKAPEFLRQIDEELKGSENEGGSLARHIIATYGTERSALTEDEVQELKTWFDNGGGRTDEELAEAEAN